MSHLISYMKMVQTFCEESPEIDDTLKEIERLQKENQLLEKEVEDEESESIRLQIELANLELMAPPDNNPNEPTDDETNLQLMNTCWNIRSALSQIEFDKILQYNQIKMQEKHHNECQQLEDNIARLLKGHQEMEQRDVVQRYRKVELEHKDAIDHLERVKKSSETILDENLTRLQRIEKKRNDLIVYIIAGSKEMQKLKAEYQHLREYSEKIVSLRKRKADLMEQLEAAESQSIFALKPYTNNTSNSQQSPPKVLPQINRDMPKFPSFDDILKSVKQDLAPMDFTPEVIVIENTTNITVKSILRKNHDNSMEFNQSIATYQTQNTKQVCFKMPREEVREFYDNMDTTDSSDDSQDTVIDVSEMNRNINEPTEMTIQDVSIKPTANDSSPQDKENISPLAVDEMEEPTEYRQKTDYKLMPPPYFSKNFNEVPTNISSPELCSGSESETDRYILKDTNIYHSPLSFNNELTFPNHAVKQNSDAEEKEDSNNVANMDCLSFETCTFDFSDNNDAFANEYQSGGIIDFIL